MSPAGTLGASRSTTRLVDATAGRVARPLLAASSTLRRPGIVHPRGRLAAARLEVEGDGDLAGSVLGQPGTLEALVRFSRTLGLPEPWPDAAFGLAVRLPDADGSGGAQDLLLLTSAPGPGARQVILPARGHADGFLSSITPLRINGRRYLLGAWPQRATGVGVLARLDDLAAAIDAGALAFEVVLAPPTGPWRPVARLHLAAALPDDAPRPHFSTEHRAGGLEPIGALNGLRRRAYLGSQGARTP